MLSQISESGVPAKQLDGFHSEFGIQQVQDGCLRIRVSKSLGAALSGADAGSENQ